VTAGVRRRGAAAAGLIGLATIGRVELLALRAVDVDVPAPTGNTYGPPAPLRLGRPPWWRQAACRGRETALWFPTRGDAEAVRQARTICGSCPVREACLSAALDEELNVVGEASGIRGGVTAKERERMLRAIRRSRRSSAAG